MITKKQNEIYGIIRNFIDKNGYSPTVREICTLSGLKSPSSVHRHIKKLEKEGLLNADSKKSRTITSEKDVSFKKVPLLGTVTAGTPIFAEGNIEEYYPVPQSVATGDDVFMLKIKGDSMIMAGIFDKDLIIVEKCSSADTGDIVVALIDDSATVKRLALKDGRYFLMPENPAYSPIFSDDMKIIGKVKGLIRKF